MTSDRHQVSTPQLVRQFFETATDSFAPWIRSQSGTWTTKLIHANRDGHLEATTPDALHGFFLASGEFQTPTLFGEITFGDKEYFINTVVGSARDANRHGLWEWADVCDRPDLVPRNADFVLQSERLTTIVREMATGLRELAPVISAADPELLARIAAARALVQSAHDARLREMDHADAVSRASEAFRKKDWRRVIELLGSVRDRLSPAELAKLVYAQVQVS